MPLQQQMRFFLRATGSLHEASVLMLRLSYPTETVSSNKITRNRMVLSFKDSPRKPLRRQPMAAYSKHVSLLYCCCCCISNFNDDDDGAQFFSSWQSGDGSSGLVRLVPSERAAITLRSKEKEKQFLQTLFPMHRQHVYKSSRGRAKGQGIQSWNIQSFEFGGASL